MQSNRSAALEPRAKKRQKIDNNNDNISDMALHPDLQAAVMMGQQMEMQSQMELAQSMNGQADSQDYPRRRAAIACETCRARKSKCEGGRPKCKLCLDMDCECIYREPGMKLDAGDRMILEQLSRIENMLHSSNAHSAYGYSNGSNTNLHPEDALAYLADATHAPAKTTINTSNSEINESTNLADLSRWPVISDLITSSISNDVFAQLEIERPRLNRIDPVVFATGLDLSDMASKAEQFFQSMYYRYTLLHRSTWQAVLTTASLSNFTSGLESCIVLLTAALGCYSSMSGPFGLDNEVTMTSLDLYRRAQEILPDVVAANTIPAIQCLVLNATYLYEIYRPLEAWNQLTLASSKISILEAVWSKHSDLQKDLVRRLAWGIRILKSTIESGMSLRSPETKTQFPTGLPVAVSQTRGQRDSVDDTSFLQAKIGLLRLSQRINQNHHAQLGKERQLEFIINNSLQVERQLENWFNELPEGLRFQKMDISNNSSLQSSLRFEYFTLRANIFRPIVLLALQDATYAIDGEIIECCRQCLEASVRQIEFAPFLSNGHIHDRWRLANDIATETLFVLGATLSRLADLLPTANDMTRIIDNAIIELERFNNEISPSIVAKASILRSAEMQRQSILLRR